MLKSFTGAHYLKENRQYYTCISFQTIFGLRKVWQSYQSIWLFQGVARSRKGVNLTQNAKSVKYHPKRPLLMQKLKNCYLLVPRLLVVSTSGATSIPKDAKLTNAHSSSTCINEFGVVVIFAK